MSSFHIRALVALLGVTLLTSSSIPASAHHRAVAHHAAPHSAGTIHTYDTGTLAGHRVEDLYADYLGVSGLLPARISVDWNKRLEYLWEAKAHQNHLSPETKHVGTLLVHEYRTKDPERMTIATYEKIADHQAATMRQSTDWGAVGSYYGLNSEQLRALRAAASDINGRVLISYALTELMPGRSNGAFNRDYLDFLLRNAGRRYVESIPAMHDNRISFGPYQFTSLALGERVGASKFNQAIQPAARIPGSVMYLRGNDHFRAAYLFAMNNTAETVKRMNKAQLATFVRVHASKRSELAQFIAVSHNKPTNGRKGAFRWLSSKARHPFTVSVAGASGIYARKTSSNYGALSSK